MTDFPPLPVHTVSCCDSWSLSPLTLPGWEIRCSLPGSIFIAAAPRVREGCGARLGRHLRRDKAVRWHIDYLSGVAAEVAGVVVPEVTECDLRKQASAFPNTKVPVPGFGSSDCRSCPAHLLLLAD